MGRPETEEPDVVTPINNNNDADEDKPKELPKKIKILTAIAIFWGNVTFGCVINSYSPVLTSLQNKYETDDATISRIFTIITGCYMVSALLVGVVYNYLNRQLCCIVILSVMAGVMFVTPWCPDLTTFYISGAVLGLCIGSYDTAQFVWLMEMMQKDCPPYVQGQHFSYAIGTNLVTLIMAPFLDDEEDDGDGIVSSTLSDDGTKDYDKLFIPFTIVGCLMGSTALYQIFLFVFFRYYPPPPEKAEPELPEIKDAADANPEDGEEHDQVMEKQEEQKPFIGTWSLPKTRLVILGALTYGALQSMEMTTFSFYSKFGQNSELALTESQAAYTLTAMTAAYAVGRGAAIILVFKIASHYIVLSNIALSFIADMILFHWALWSKPALWTAAIGFGLGFSSMFGAVSAHMERYLNFTNFVGSLMIVCASGMSALYPLIVGNFIEENPIVLGYVNLFSTTVLMVVFGSILFLTSRDKTRY